MCTPDADVGSRFDQKIIDHRFNQVEESDVGWEVGPRSSLGSRLGFFFLPRTFFSPEGEKSETAFANLSSPPAECMVLERVDLS
jgi:hypothetical protein